MRNGFKEVDLGLKITRISGEASGQKTHEENTCVQGVFSNQGGKAQESLGLESNNAQLPQVLKNKTAVPAGEQLGVPLM